MINGTLAQVVPAVSVRRSSTVNPSAHSEVPSHWSDEYIDATCCDSLLAYESWPDPTIILSDGAYGLLGFEGDTADHLGIPEWYEPHVAAWSRRATPQTTLWFWNSEIGWAAAHPILEKFGWRYVNANIWNKGKAHIAGNVNTNNIRRFPVVSELCVQYVMEAKINDQPIQDWLIQEWKRTGLPLKRANDACGVKDAAVRKYLDRGRDWYQPPPDMFERMQRFANQFGQPDGRPYFSADGVTPMTASEWRQLRSKFYCPHGITNVWDRKPLRGRERIKVNGSNGRAAHLNQKPLDLLAHLIEASSDKHDVVWEPFGGLFSASIAARQLHRRAYGAEINPPYFAAACQRFADDAPELSIR